jgi:hypothetical protein
MCHWYSKLIITNNLILFDYLESGKKNKKWTNNKDIDTCTIFKQLTKKDSNTWHIKPYNTKTM